jgi:hypothetical protein
MDDEVEGAIKLFHHAGSRVHEIRIQLQVMGQLISAAAPPLDFPAGMVSPRGMRRQFKLTQCPGRERHVTMRGRARKAKAMPGHEDEKNKIGLVEAIAAVRAELSEAAVQGTGAPIQFPVDGVELEFHVGLTRTAGATGAVRIWVVELAASGSYESETVQKVKVRLGAPVNPQGETLKVDRDLPYKP